MNCPNCGSEVKENTSYCSYCGTMLKSDFHQPEMEQYSNSSMEVVENNIEYSQIEYKNVFLAVLLTILTCGIYGLYWYICMTDESNVLVDTNKTASGGLAILFTILTCGIYHYYWTYKMGKKLHEAGVRHRREIEDNSILYIFLNIICLSILNFVMIQNDLNKFANR